jgi:chemotaxis protein methyltransferase CheR
MPDLLIKLEGNAKLVEEVVKKITVSTTELFRDPNAWQELRYNILPELGKNREINIWHAGCSTGQELYSMLILLNELGLFEKAKVIGTDLNEDAIKVARKGIYRYHFNLEYLDNFDKVIRENPFDILEYNDVPYKKYFKINKSKDVLEMRNFLKKKAIFQKHDLVTGKNPMKDNFDLILCRNVIIYFKYDLQSRVFNLLCDHLSEGGYLLFGMHESMIGNITEAFERTGYFYRKKI